MIHFILVLRQDSKKSTEAKKARKLCLRSTGDDSEERKVTKLVEMKHFVKTKQI